MNTRALHFTKLYWKIFLGFWLTTMLVLLGTNLVTHLLDLGPGEHFAPQQQDRPDSGAARMLRYAARAAINHTEAEVAAQVHQVPSWAMRYLYIVNEDGEDLLERRIPERVSLMMERLSPHTPYQRVRLDDTTLFGRLLVLSDGKVLRMVATSNPEDSTVLWHLYIWNFLPVFLAAVLISGTICFCLARYLTRPIQTLKKATRRIAGGDLSVRVVPEFKGHHNEIAELGHDFDHMITRLQEAMAEQKRLIKDVSHELRSPLMRLQFALGLAQQRSNGNVDEELNRIKEAADYLNDIISDILSLPISENESWDLNDVVDLKALLETLLDAYQAQAEKKQVSLCLDCIHESLVSTHGNSLVGVFENLINNALRYTEPNTTIQVQVEQQGSYQIVHVCDSGPGLAEDQLESIFKPFFRSDEARTRANGGYGLGLTIAQRTVSLHGGKISASNRPEGGLCVSVTLPIGSFE